MNKDNGFSLVELLVVLAVIIIIISLINDDFFQTMRYWVNVNTIADVEQHLRYSMETLTRDLRNADVIEYNNSGTREDIVRRVDLDLSEVYFVDDSTETEFSLENNELFRNGNSLGNSFKEVSIRRVNLYTFGSLYEIYLETIKLDFERVPNLTMRKYIFVPNAKP
ncbi:MAG: prepilin-type N-terminal cleavage/methylation domain-containing protein [Halanaerobiales bacterium]